MVLTSKPLNWPHDRVYFPSILPSVNSPGISLALNHLLGMARAASQLCILTHPGAWIWHLPHAFPPQLVFLANFYSTCKSPLDVSSSVKSSLSYGVTTRLSFLQDYSVLKNYLLFVCSPQALQLWHKGSVVVTHRLSCPVACGILAPPHAC